MPRPVIGCAFSASTRMALIRSMVPLDMPRTFLGLIPCCSPVGHPVTLPPRSRYSSTCCSRSRFAPWVRSSDGTPLLAGRCGRGRRRHRCLDLDLLCPQCLPQIAMACADFDVGDGQLGGGMYRLHWVVVLLWGQTTDTGRPPIGASSDEFSLDAWLAWGLGR